MPLFPDERPMTPEEGEMGTGFLNYENAFAHEGAYLTSVTGLALTPASFRTGNMLDSQYGLPPGTAHISVVDVQNGDFDGYIIARPFRQIAPGHFEPDPHRWWVFDSDLDESDAAWVPQATFTPDGLIDHGEAPEDGLDDDSEDLTEALRDGRIPYRAPQPPEPRGPIKSIDDVLDDADDKLTPQWRKIGSNFEVLESPLGTAFLCHTPGHTYGIIRYADGVCIEVRGAAGDEIRHKIPGALRERPVTLKTLDLDEADATPKVANESKVDPLADTEPPKRPPPRKWSTVSIESGREDD